MGTAARLRKIPSLSAPPAYVKPFVKRQKNDAIDAEAISEAAQRPSMRFVAVKRRATGGGSGVSDPRPVGAAANSAHQRGEFRAMVRARLTLSSRRGPSSICRDSGWMIGLQPPAKFSDRGFAAQAVEHDADSPRPHDASGLPVGCRAEAFRRRTWISVSQVLKRDTCQSRARFHEQEVLVSGVERSHQSGGEGLSETRRTSGRLCRALFAEYTSSSPSLA